MGCDVIFCFFALDDMIPNVGGLLSYFVDTSKGYGIQPWNTRFHAFFFEF